MLTQMGLESCVPAAAGSGGVGHTAQPRQRQLKPRRPWPAGGQVQDQPAGGAGQPAGQVEQGPAQRLGYDQFLAGAQSDGGDPAQQVVGQGGDQEPGGVGGELARGAVPQAHAALEVADAQLDRGVAAVILVQPHGGADSVGDEGVVAPVREQLRLFTHQTGAAHDQPVTLVAGLGDLGDAALGIDDVDPCLLVDGGDRLADRFGLADGHGVVDLVAAAGADGLGRPEAGVGAYGQLAAGAGAAHPGGQLLDEPGGAAGGVGPPDPL